MRILVCVRQVPDGEDNLSIENGFLSLAESKLVLDGMDEYGVEEALRLREAGTNAEIIAVGVGPESSLEALRSALAMGVDRAIHVQGDTYLDPLCIAQVVARIATMEEATLILTGGQQADWDSHALGPAIATWLRWPQVTWVSQLSLEKGVLSGTHDVDDGREQFSLPLPAVVTTQQGLNQPRYPTLPNILRAKQKELRRVSLTTYNVTPRLQILGQKRPLKSQVQRILDGTDAAHAASMLVDLLRNEAKVLA
jgi:electron transfer flavoprotein beta subunit